jgi:CRISPR-associated endonuclease/helicase Cas3
MSTAPTAIAHTAPPGGVAHPLSDHLLSVAKLAAEFARPWLGEEWAALAGLWHDLGKYDPDFQVYLARVGGEDAHLESDASPAGKTRGPEHSIAGAEHAIEKLGEINGRILAYCIAGHHAGLPDWIDAPFGSLHDRIENAKKRGAVQQAKRGGAPAGILDTNSPLSGPSLPNHAACAFFIRMVFSALVDADFLDTEAHFNQTQPISRGGWPLLSEMAPLLDAHLDELTRRAQLEHPGPVTDVRLEVLTACRTKAGLPPGLFTLTVPTGGGKTLASLAFALRHAQAHGLRRVIYAIPYISIIEQTAKVFRGVFAPLGDAVLEHHSSLALDRETNRTRLASENWDAPLIVTTTVQLFESLFAARTSRCRKLHNIANSVLILDEAQLLPLPFLRPILFALDELMARYGVSIVISTATQPALMERDGFKGLRAPARELAPEPERLRQALRRTGIERLHDLTRPVAWDEIADLVAAEPRALCIVDRRDAARDLLGLLPAGTFHLSALMCPEHRGEVLETIRARLVDPARPDVRVVATQLIEAGVDVDFPVVFRSVAGLDSIAQAAGRCNREGRMPDLGRVVLFRAPQEPPAGVLRQAAQIALPMLRRPDDDPLTLTAFTRFFGQLYWAHGDKLDRESLVSGRSPLLGRPAAKFAFRTAAERFRIIPDEQVPLVVPWGNAAKIVQEIEQGGPNRDRMRRLQRLTVGVYRRTAEGLLQERAAREISSCPGLLILEDERLYDHATGLDIRRIGVYAPEESIW